MPCSAETELPCHFCDTRAAISHNTVDALLTSSNNTSTLYQGDSEMNNAEQETHCSVYFPPFTFSEALPALIYCYE